MQNKLNINTIPDDFLLRNIIKISIEIFMSILTLSWVTEVQATVTTRHTQCKNQGRRSVGSKAGIQTACIGDWWTRLIAVSSLTRSVNRFKKKSLLYPNKSVEIFTRQWSETCQLRSVLHHPVMSVHLCRIKMTTRCDDRRAVTKFYNKVQSLERSS